MSAPAAVGPLFEVRSGLATLAAPLVALRDALDRLLLGWAAATGAEPMLFPALVPVAQLETLDYFRNFPHLAVVASHLRHDRLEPHYAAGGSVAAGIPAGDLCDGRYVLPSAACYSIYLHLADSVLAAPCYVTTIATCFRNESSFDDLRRLWSFSMREIVCLGTVEAVQQHLAAGKRRILDLGERLGLGLDIAVASDPFYQPQGPLARMQKLFPQKEEVLFEGQLAIASLNFHRNFFGERCRISMPAGDPVYTGCVAFGLERWLHALLTRFDGDAGAACAALAAAGTAAP